MKIIKGKVILGGEAAKQIYNMAEIGACMRRKKRCGSLDIVMAMKPCDGDL